VDGWNPAISARHTDTFSVTSCSVLWWRRFYNKLLLHACSPYVCQKTHYRMQQIVKL